MTYSKCRSTYGSIQLFVIPITLVIQLYAIAHITYYKWKYHGEDNRVHVLQQQPAVFTVGSEIEKMASAKSIVRPQLRGKIDEENQIQENRIPHLNTKAHNTLLFEITHMVCYVSTIIVAAVTRKIIESLSKDEYYTVSAVIFYAQDFVPGFIMQVMFPFFFYLYNPDVRMYIKQLFMT